MKQGVCIDGVYLGTVIIIAMKLALAFAFSAGVFSYKSLRTIWYWHGPFLWWISVLSNSMNGCS